MEERLAIAYALERFRQYTFGQNVLVRSDHTPLQSILKKPLASAPRRLQGMMTKDMTSQSAMNVARICSRLICYQERT